AYRGGLEAETSYLFVMDDSGDGKNRDTQGFMPQGRQFGYIFLKNIRDSREDVNQVIAHELGHGRWKLSHTFDSTYGGKIAKEDKLNLMSYGGGIHLAKWQWDVMDMPAWFANPLDGDDKGMYIGGTFYLADWTPVRFNYSSICETSDIVPSGTIEGIIFNNLPYSAKYENNKWEYKNGSDILSGIEVVKDIKGSDKVYLIREVFEGCSEIYSTTHDYVMKNKENPNIFDGAEFEYYTGDCSKENAESQGIVIIRQCDEDPYYVKHRYAVQAADGTTTWGQKIVKNLNSDIHKNAQNKYGDDLDNVQLNSLHYINQGVNYKGNDIFTPSYIEELNHKLAYLEVSSGVQLYVRFIEVTCTFSPTEGSKFAKDIFENSEISKTKGIYVLVVRNTEATGELEWKTYFAFGSDISGDLKASAENLLTINNETKFPAFGTSLIQFYKKVPKKQKQYIHVIEKATQQERSASEHSFLTKRILGKTEIKENQTGNAIRAVYYLLDTETNALYSLNTETSESKELKEQYVADEGVDLGKLYAEKEAGWRLTYYDIRGERYSISPTIFDCKFTLEKTCVQQAIDAGSLVAGIASVPFGNVAIVVDGLAVVYYLNTGQTDMAMAYLAGYAIGPVIGQTIKGIAAVTPKIVRFSQKLYVETRLVLQLERGVTEQGVKTLLNRAVENGKVVEYLIPDNTYGNLFVKATDDEVLVGYVKTEQNKDILVVLANKKGANALTGKFANATEEDVKRLADDVVREAGNLPSVVRIIQVKSVYLPDRLPITSTPNKTTTFIGRWSDLADGEERGLKVLYNELTTVNKVSGQSVTDLNVYMLTGKFDHPGGFNMLSIDDWSKIKLQLETKGIKEGTKAFDDFIWETYNRPWLESAMQRGDN
ncbi:MAG: hypothetical protein LBV43_02680, partial [Prevotella sp.]|nr:hypothetical protein [Prevotella sp.]